MMSVDDYEAMFDYACDLFHTMDMADEDEEALYQEVGGDAVWAQWKRQFVNATANREDELMLDLAGNLDADHGFGRYVRDAASVDWSAA